MTEIAGLKFVKILIKLGFIVVPLIYYKGLTKKRDKALEDFYIAYEREDYDRALWLINRYIEEKPKDFGGYLHKGSVLKDLGQIDEAMEAFKTSISLKEVVFDSQKILADCYLEQEDYRLAIDHYDIAIKDEKGRLSARFNRGIAYMHLESYSKALKDFKYVLRMEDGDKSYIYDELSAVYLLMGDSKNHEKYEALSQVN